MPIYARVVKFLHVTDLYKSFSLQSGKPREMTIVYEVCGEPVTRSKFFLVQSFRLCISQIKFLKLVAK